MDSFDQDMQSLEGQVQSTTTYVSQELRTGSKATYSSMQQASNLTAAASAYVKASEAVRSEVETTRRDVAYALGVFAKAMAALSASMAFVAIVVGFLRSAATAISTAYGPSRQRRLLRNGGVFLRRTVFILPQLSRVPDLRGVRSNHRLPLLGGLGGHVRVRSRHLDVLGGPLLRGRAVPEHVRRPRP